MCRAVAAVMCHSCARVRGNDGFRILLTQPAPNVPIIDSDGATPPEDSVLLGYLLEVQHNDTPCTTRLGQQSSHAARSDPLPVTW